MKYTFEDFNEDINKIVNQIQASGKTYDYIVGLVRGGSIPAVVISHRMVNNPEVIMQVWGQDVNRRDHNWWIQDEIINGKKVLIVDDIVDSGRCVKELLADWDVSTDLVDVAALIYNTSQDIKVEYYGRTIDRNTDVQWVDFWWEK